LTLFGHFIDVDVIQDFVNNDSTQWFDIIASFAIFLGSLNLIKLQLIKIAQRQKNWQYSILAVVGFFFAIFAGFFFRGSNYIVVEDVTNSQAVSEIIAESTPLNSAIISDKINAINGEYEIPHIFITHSAAVTLEQKLSDHAGYSEVRQKKWGAHLQTKGSLFYWMFDHIFTPLSATMFALLAFFVASASYRAFRIRNFEATLLLVAGIILMLGRVPVGKLISGWYIAYLTILGIAALISPLIRDRRILFGIVGTGVVIVTIAGFWMGWDPQQPSILFLPNLQEWIFTVPTAAGARAIMIGIALGIVGTSFRIITGIERSFLGE
jgi:hypothetical protein